MGYSGYSYSRPDSVEGYLEATAGLRPVRNFSEIAASIGISKASAQMILYVALGKLAAKYRNKKMFDLLPPSVVARLPAWARRKNWRKAN